MNWPGSKPSAGPEGQMPGPEKGRSAMPPQCPRCEVTKAQFTRTIQNYQKAYRKKVEGLKTELKATRNTNDALRKQVRQLKSVVRVHLPSLVVGVAIGVAVKTYQASIRRLFRRQAAGQAATEAAADADQPQTPVQTEESAVAAA